MYNYVCMCVSLSVTTDLAFYAAILEMSARTDLGFSNRMQALCMAEVSPQPHQLISFTWFLNLAVLMNYFLKIGRNSSVIT